MAIKEKKRVIFKEYQKFSLVGFGKSKYKEVIGKRSKYNTELPDNKSAILADNKYLYIFTKTPFPKLHKNKSVFTHIKHHKVKAGQQFNLIYSEGGKPVSNYYCYTSKKLSRKRIARLKEYIRVSSSLVDDMKLELFNSEKEWKNNNNSWKRQNTLYYPPTKKTNSSTKKKEEKPDLNVVFLTDYLATVKGLTNKYSSEMKKFEKFMKKEETVKGPKTTEKLKIFQWAGMADIIHRLCTIKGKESRYSDHIAQSAFNSWRKGFKAKIDKERKKFDEIPEILFRFMDREIFDVNVMHTEFSDDGDDKYETEDIVGDAFKTFANTQPCIKYLAYKFKSAIKTLKELEQRYGPNKKLTSELINDNYLEVEWLTIFFASPRKISQGYGSFIALLSVNLKKEIDNFDETYNFFKKILKNRSQKKQIFNKNKSKKMTPISSFKKHYKGVSDWRKKLKKQYGKSNVKFEQVTPSSKVEGKKITKWYAYVPLDQLSVNDKNIRKLCTRERSYQSFSKALEIANIVFAFYQLIDNLKNDKGELGADTVNLIGSAVDFYEAFFAKSLKQSYALGIVSGIFDTIGHGISVDKSASISDDDAAVAYFFAGSGSAFTAIGSGMMLYAQFSAVLTGVASTGIGLYVIIAGMAIQAIAMVIAEYLKDDDFEIWLEHCFWGDSYGEDDEKTDWSIKKLKSWKGDFTTQMRALNNIFFSFRWEFENFYENNPRYWKYPHGMPQLTIYPKMVKKETKIYVTVILYNKISKVTLMNNEEVYQSGQCTIVKEKIVKENDKKDKKDKNKKKKKTIEYRTSKIFVRWYDTKVPRIKKRIYGNNYGYVDVVPDLIQQYLISYKQYTFYCEKFNLIKVSMGERRYNNEGVIADKISKDVIHHDNLGKKIDIISSYDPIIGDVKNEKLKALIKIKLDPNGTGESSQIVEVEKRIEFFQPYWPIDNNHKKKKEVFSKLKDKYEDYNGKPIEFNYHSY